MVESHKMIREPLNCGYFLDKFYLSLHENGHEIYPKINYEKVYKHFRPEVQATLSSYK